jgi:hypothetical protein
VDIMTTAKRKPAKNPVKRRMNALLQIALMRAVDLHSYPRPEVAECYSVNERTDTASFYFDSAHGREVGNGELTLPIWIHEDNTEIISRLVDAIRRVTGVAEHHYRQQVRQSARVACQSFPADNRTILSTVLTLI